MTDETVYEAVTARNRSAIASFLRRMADAFDRDGPIPVDESTTVDPPTDTELEVELEREGEEMSLEFEMEWDEAAGELDTDADVGDEAAPGTADVDGVAGSQASFELYRDRADEWRWRLRHANGNVIADSGEGYTKKANAENGIESVKRNAAGAVVEEQD